MAYNECGFNREIQVIDSFLEDLTRNPDCRPEVLALRQREADLADAFMEASWEVHANGDSWEFPIMETRWKAWKAMRQEIALLSGQNGGDR